MSYSTQAILLAVVPKVPAVLSMLGSSYIVRNVLRDGRRRRKPFHRIMLGMSCSDISASTVYFLGTWLIPRGTVGQYGSVFMASGNDGTCNLSGFFTQFAVCSPLYNGTLSLYYLLVILFGWKEDQIITIEPILHCLPVLFAFATAVTALALDLYGSVEWLCWINPDPPQANFRVFQWTFLFVPLWICMLFVTFVMIALYWKMKQLEQQMTNYAGGRQSTRQKKRSQEIAVQGMLYVSAFYITWFFPSLQRIIEVVANKNYFVLQMFDTALLPLQGLFNVIVYTRPRVMQYRKTHPNMSWWGVLWNANDTQRASVLQMSDAMYLRSNHVVVTGRDSQQGVATTVVEDYSETQFQPCTTSGLTHEREPQAATDITTDDAICTSSEPRSVIADIETGNSSVSAGRSSSEGSNEDTAMRACVVDEENCGQVSKVAKVDVEQATCGDNKDIENTRASPTIYDDQVLSTDETTISSPKSSTDSDEHCSLSLERTDGTTTTTAKERAKSASMDSSVFAVSSEIEDAMA